MGIFSEWAKNNVISEEHGDNPEDKFKFSGGNSTESDRPVDYEKARGDLFRLVMDKYPEESMRFLHDIAQRGDQEVKNLLSQIDIGSKPHEFREPRRSRDIDDVVPSSADAASGE